MNFTKLKQFMDDLTERKVPGNAVAVYVANKLVFSYASGYADLESHTPMTGREYLNIYSCSKVATVTAGLQLLESGKFLLTDPLYDYIPEYRHMAVQQADGSLREAQHPITIGDLFGMTAGFTYRFDTPAFEKARQLTNGKMDTATVVRCLAADPLSFEPGERWQYSLCHDVLAGLISIIVGKPFRTYVKENLFEPLDMTQSFYHHTLEIEKQMASQYAFVPNGAESNFDLVKAQKYGKTEQGVMVNVGKQVSHVLGEEYDSGGAGITTTVGDYAKLVAALANNGLGMTGAHILSKGTVELLRTNRLNEKQRKDFSWPHLAGYGYGCGVRTLMDKAAAGSVGSVGEFGWGGAAGATVLVDPECQLGVFYAHHMLNPQEAYYQPRLRNIVYACLDH